MLRQKGRQKRRKRLLKIVEVAIFFAEFKEKQYLYTLKQKITLQ